MKRTLTKLSWPILKFFEGEDISEHYKPSQRLTLNIISALFLFLSVVSAVSLLYSKQYGALFPVIIFFVVGLVLLLVGTLGSNSAVARIWGKRR